MVGLDLNDSDMRGDAEKGKLGKDWQGNFFLHNFMHPTLRLMDDWLGATYTTSSIVSNTAIVSAITGTKFYLTKLVINVGGDNTVDIKVGTTSVLGGPVNLSANGGIVIDFGVPRGSGTANQSINITTTAAETTTVYLEYIKVTS